MTRETDYFQAICKVSKAMGTTLGQEEILSLIVGSAIETMRGKAACLFLADEQADVFVPVAQSGLSDKYLHAKPMQARKVVNDVLKGGYLVISDATTDSRLENHEEKKAEGIASILVVPVMASGEAIGVLSLYSGSPRDFSESDAEFLSALAEQGGMAIQRARLFSRIQRNSELFYDLASTINSSLDIRKILHMLTSDICEALDMKGAVIRLLNKEQGTLDLVASWALSEDYLNKGPVSASQSIREALNGDTVMINDVATDPRVQYRDATIREGIASMLCVPIKAHGDVIGVLKLCSAGQREFAPDQIKLVEALAHQGGLAIHNASTCLMLQEDKKTLEDEIWSHRQWF